MQLTDYHAKYFAYELTKRSASDSVEKLVGALADAQVDLNPHQVDAALFAFRNPFSRGAILADEVGLGKTIEAGLLLSQHWAERKRKLLIILPANLRKQWSQELADKFHLPSAILESRTFNEAIRAGNLNPFVQPGIVLCSYQFARAKEPYIRQVAWDLVVIDEAHRLRNVYKTSSRIALAIKNAIAPFPKVLLTATPLQNSLLELYGLVSIIDDFAFGDLKSFRSRFSRLGNDADFSELKERLKPICKRTLRRQVLEYVPCPAPNESVDFDTSGNLIIEGDNLEVLKLFQKSYLGRVKMIYIDPPYNTGNDFIYPDNYAESLQTYLEYTGQVDASGAKFGTNFETDGRFHSKWLNMMYPRLYLARNLLRDDGLIFISVDDTESANLRAVLNEVFGEEHFLAAIAWEKRYTRSNNARLFYSLKDTILVYRKSDAVSYLREARTDESIYRNPDNDPRGPWTSSSYVNPATKEERKNLVYKIENPFSLETVEHPTHAWKYELSEHQRHVREKRLWWGQKGDAKFPRLKVFLSEVGDGIVPIDIWDYEQSGTTDEGGQEVKELFGEAAFDNPKPTKLVRRMLGLATRSSESDIVLDFLRDRGPQRTPFLLKMRLTAGTESSFLFNCRNQPGAATLPLSQKLRRSGFGVLLRS